MMHQHKMSIFLNKILPNELLFDISKAINPNKFKIDSNIFLLIKKNNIEIKQFKKIIKEWCKSSINILISSKIIYTYIGLFFKEIKNN
ncbi:hypothetical protein Mgra_00008780 [Meloidogyne graminicola]|uniref:Uncharacterized protein n=1 Tax=Meloidogyne graminicola TaxID=189291 RepID=A0A8S9ZEU5_9BILA|nr:hypothetical protein Mgra_00008780 [Meloidogyne graminicola]